MMPLWTTTILPWQSWWGWAFSSLGRPWVAQRVWPIPKAPAMRLRAQALLEVLELAHGAPAVQLAVLHHGDARGVIAAVLEAAQALDDDRHRLPRSDVADDPAHSISPFAPCRRRCCRCRCARRPRMAQPGFITCRARPEGQRPRGHVLGDGAARRHVGAFAHRDRRHQRAVAADEGPGLDRGGVLVGAVVVAGDGARRRC